METAHRLPYLQPRQGEGLDAFMARAADEHRWPPERRAEDMELLRRLLLEHLPPEDALPLAGYLIRALSFAADPGMSLRFLDRYVRSLGERAKAELRDLRHNVEHLHFLCSLFAFSEYLSEAVIKHPDYLPHVFRHSRLNREKPLDRYREQLREWMEGIEGRAARRAALTRYKKRELLRIGIRDLLEMGDTSTLCRELSNLAQAILEIALQDEWQTLAARFGQPTGESGQGPSGFCVYAMGKFGAGELNFSSDVDLIYLYEEEGETEGGKDRATGRTLHKIPNHEFFNKLASELSSYLSAHNEEGFLYRVDARLRPEGSQGPLARSRSAFAAYLNTQADLWEKVAYHKARCVAGDMDLAARLDQIIEQFVYSGNVREELFPEMARLMRRIDHEVLSEDSRLLDIKRGVGGIREIEFIVSGLQLLAAEKNPTLRLRSTLAALAELENEGILLPQDARPLAEAYHLYRRIEHTLQMMHESQTHRLPASPKERAALGLRCGFSDPEEFERTLDASRRFVRSQYEEIFGGTNKPGEMSLLDYLLMEGDPPNAVLGQLRPAGLGDLEGFRALQQLAVGTREFAPSPRSRLGFQQLLPMLLEELPHVALPRLAVRQFELLLRASRGYSWIYNLCLSHPPILKLILRTLGFGTMLGRHLSAHPEWLDEMLHGDGLSASRLDEALKEIKSIADKQAPTEGLARLRRRKQLESFLLSVQEVLSIVPFPEAAERMSLLAEGVLAAAARLAERDVLSDTGEDRLPVPWAIIGMGGLGDRQVHLGGDLDVAFIIEKDMDWHGRPATEWAERIARRTVEYMSGISPEGQLWKVDARLRPDGRGGPLAPTRGRVLDYYRNEAGTWEWQALTKARPAAGDHDFGAGVLRDLYNIYTEQGAPPGLGHEILSMRLRMQENARVPRHAECEYKLGKGGLVDVEFLVQFFQLRESTEPGHLFPLTTNQAIEEFEKRGVLTGETAEFVKQHHARLRLLQRTNRLLWETTRDHLTADPEKKAALQRAMNEQSILTQTPAGLDLKPAMEHMRTLLLEFLEG